MRATASLPLPLLLLPMAAMRARETESQPATAYGKLIATAATGSETELSLTTATGSWCEPKGKKASVPPGDPILPAISGDFLSTAGFISHPECSGCEFYGTWSSGGSVASSCGAGSPSPPAARDSLEPFDEQRGLNWNNRGLNWHNRVHMLKTDDPSSLRAVANRTSSQLVLFLDDAQLSDMKGDIAVQLNNPVNHKQPVLTPTEPW
eukprot:SAG11_NODE_11334_length_768_cov_0.744395_1_plen_206_part_10